MEKSIAVILEKKKLTPVSVFPGGFGRLAHDKSPTEPPKELQ